MLLVVPYHAQGQPSAEQARIPDEFELFVDAKEAKKWECSICYKVMQLATYCDNAEHPNDPRSEPCGHNYCLVSDSFLRSGSTATSVLQECLKRSLTADPHCPGCRRPSDKKKLKALPTRREIGSLRIKCPKSAKEHGGCSWVGDYGLDGANFKKHVAECQFTIRKCKVATCEVRCCGVHGSLCSLCT